MTKIYQHAHLFYHTQSGAAEIYDLLGEITPFVSQLAHQITFHQTQAAGEIEAFCEQLTHGSTTIDLLLVAGGDGTVNELVNGLVRNQLQIPMGIIPAGTFNDFSRTLHISPKPAVAAEQLLSSSEVQYDVLQVNDQFALNFVGLGLMIQTAENVNPQTKSILGKLSYLVSSMKTLTNPVSFTYHLTLDGKVYTGETFMMIIANGLYVGGKQLPSIDLSASDGFCSLFILKNTSFGALKDFLQSKTRDDWEQFSDNVLHVEGKTLTLVTTPVQKLDIDGEIGEMITPLTLTLLPKQVTILTNVSHH